MIRSLLVPLDGSSFGEHALPLAASLARAANATLHLVHVHQVVPPATVAGVAVMDALDLHLRQDEQAYLADVTRRLGEKGPLQVKSALIEGEVAAALKQITELLPAMWQKIKAVALPILRKVFKEGKLKEAALDVLMLLLDALQVPLELAQTVIAKGKASLDLILDKPLEFFNCKLLPELHPLGTEPQLDEWHQFPRSPDRGGVRCRVEQNVEDRIRRFDGRQPVDGNGRHAAIAQRSPQGLCRRDPGAPISPGYTIGWRVLALR